MSESAPDCQSAPTARSLMPLVYRPMPTTMLWPPLGVSISGTGAPGPWKAGGAIGDIELRHARVQADEDRVRLQMQGAGDDVAAFRDVEDAMLVDCFLEGGGIVTDTVTFYAERAEIGPGVHRRKGGDDVAAVRRAAPGRDARRSWCGFRRTRPGAGMMRPWE